MSLKDYARHLLGKSRGALEMVLAEFQSEDDWFHQPAENANHALWIAGHLGLADNMFASKFRPEVDRKPEGWEELFWYGSEIRNDRTQYSSVAEVKAYLVDRREVLLKVLDEISEEEWAAAAPPEGERGAAAGAPSIGQLFFFASFHEGIHTGQLTVAHRSLGHSPIMRPDPVEAS